MGNTLNKIEVKGKCNHLQIREIKENGGFSRRVLTPDMDISGEVQEIQDKAEEVWTDDIKSAWTAYLSARQAEDEALLKAEQEAKE